MVGIGVVFRVRAMMARRMSSPSSVKMLAHTYLTSSSWLSKYR